MSTPPDAPASPLGLDSLPPPEMALKAEQVGLAKASMSFTKTFTLAVLAGAFIALGAVFCTTVTTGAVALPYGVGRLLGGLAFCLGLILVIVAGAELFTGNALIVMAWAGGRVSTVRLLRNWLIVYLGNLAGSLGTVALVLAGGQYAMAGGAVGLNALNLAQAKCSLEFVPALALGLLCNALVCLAVWLCFSARTLGDRVAAIVFPITAFVACGFEHSVANMYFIPAGLGVKALAGQDFWRAIGRAPADFPLLTWSNFLLANLLPVTLGNIIGGAVLVGLAYWFVFLRGRARDRQS
ncbi:MAG: formate transporter FocA [Desulfarculus sp.]|nr:formate transporter FocA [Desulfarculus sp.]